MSGSEESDKKDKSVMTGQPEMQNRLEGSDKKDRTDESE